MSNLIHDEARKPDAVTKTLRQGFEWTATHSTLAASAVGIAILGLAGFFGIQGYNHSKEMKLQEQLFVIEKEYNKKKDGFDQAAAAPAAAPVDAKEPVPAKATGDLETDYGNLPNRFAEFAKAHATTTTSGIAALYAAEIWSKHSKRELAIESLKSAKLESGVVGAMVQMRLATLLSDSGNCPEAIGIWTMLAKNSSAGFLVNEIKLRQGYCAEKSGDVAQAESLYREVMANAKEGAEGKLAEQLIRLMKVKVN
jgi:hypothetical protein